MYCSYYGIPEKPFSITPDPKYLYLGKTHKEAFAHLLYGIRERGGFIVITGEIGTGKTTLCRALLAHLDPETLVAFLFNPTLSSLELLKCINEDFGIPSHGDTKKELIDELNRFLLEQRKSGKNTVLIIDEVQRLDPEVLEHIRLLSNLETDTEKLLQIILIGQPEFRQILAEPGLLQLNQRVTVRYHLSALSKEETVAYVLHRLSVAGAADKVHFTPQALGRIYRYTKGVPRLVNVLCDRALLAGYTLGTRQIDREVIDRAHKEVSGSSWPGVLFRLRGLFRKGLVPGTFAFLVICLLFWFVAYRTGDRSEGSPAAALAPQTVVSQSPAYDTPVPGGPLMVHAEGTSGLTDSGGGKSRLPDTGSPAVGQGGGVMGQGVGDASAQGGGALQGPVPAQPEAGRRVGGIQVVGRADVKKQVPPSFGSELGVSPVAEDLDAFNDSDLPFAEEAGAISREDLLRTLTGMSLVETREEAFLAVVQQWRQFFAEGSPIPDWRQAGWDIYGASEALGFKCFRLNGNMSRLVALNLPVILEVRHVDLVGKRYLGLLSVGESYARIAPASPHGAADISVKLLSELWFGTAYVLWRDLPGADPVWTAGMEGEMVLWLQRGLKKLGYVQGEPNAVFDEATFAAVQAFQRDHYLDDDGILGPQTKIVLYRALESFEMPSLGRPGPSDGNDTAGEPPSPVAWGGAGREVFSQ